MPFEEKDSNGALTGLSVFELEALQDWEYKFMSNKYAKVGTIKKPEGGAEQPDKSTAAEPAETIAADPAGHVPSEVSASAAKEENVGEPNKDEQFFL
uniref:membrane steroid-binding protein 2-like n=1 Tax=Erigeron canadensis TaxID=72917 RepID=UPI001CB90552|nr:membrane steroid-binding protein 2-like [Erigeron canadensis]